MAGVSGFNPDTDISSLEGKVLFITGGTKGLGRQSVQALAKHGPAHIYLTGRDMEAAASLVAELKEANGGVEVPTTLLEMDMTSLASVKAAMAKFAHDRLDVLMCNAGIMAQPPALTKDGFELQFGVNHVAHGLIIKSLLPVLQRTADTGADVRIVCLSSLAWRIHPSHGIQFDKLRTPMSMLGGTWFRYGQSKLANAVYVRELARRYPNITSVAIHPGVVQTSLVTGLGLMQRALIYTSSAVSGMALLTPAQGCHNQVWAAAAAKKDDLISGGMYYPVGVYSDAQLSSLAKSEKLAAQLWEWTDKALADY